MISQEKLKWLQDNKQHGEVAEVVRILNPNNTKKGVTYPEAASIINGNLWGKWGKAVTNELEKIIKKRLRKLKTEKEKYSHAE